ncbi:MAG: hypothetical protein ACI9G1_005448 [Pirellulaceae bacterium]|jgi:uncharacterized protein YdeI (YjbR/CyaY-like superfamily)
MKRFNTVGAFIDESKQWQDELRQLRKILTATGLDEEVKWGAPCYTYNGKNIVGMGSFKSYCGLWFFQGALLSDPHKVLINAQEGTTKALRQWRFNSIQDIKVRRIKAYVAEALTNAKRGKQIRPDRSKPITVPAELKSAFTKNKKAAAAFNELTKGKQREYTEYIADAKRDETKQSRIKKILPMIAAGQGLNDKYRS